MEKEELKTKIDFNNIQELQTEIFKGKFSKEDYLVDDEGNFMIPLSPLEFKLIEKIQELEERISKLEKKEVKR